MNRCSRTVRQAPTKPRPRPGRIESCASKGGGLAVCAAARSGSRAAADTRATLRSRPSSLVTGRTPAFAMSLPRCDAAAAARGASRGSAGYLDRCRRLSRGISYGSRAKARGLRDSRIALSGNCGPPLRRRAREKPGCRRWKAWNPGTNRATYSRLSCFTGIEDKPLVRLPASRLRGDRLPPAIRQFGQNRPDPVSKRESALHDARHPLTRFGRSPNASRLAHWSKARHRDRQTTLTEQPCNGEQANAKNDVKWRYRDRDHAGR